MVIHLKTAKAPEQLCSGNNNVRCEIPGVVWHILKVTFEMALSHQYSTRPQVAKPSLLGNSYPIKSCIFDVPVRTEGENLGLHTVS